jgi:hypothetical protein
MHRVHDLHLDTAAMADLALKQAVGDDADHLRARLQSGIGGDAHQPDGAAAIDQPDAPCRDLTPQRAGGLREGGACAGGGAAEDADATKRPHATVSCTL